MSKFSKRRKQNGRGEGRSERAKNGRVAKKRRNELRACLKSSNKNGNEGKSKKLSRNKEFAFTIFPKPAEFVEPRALKKLCKRE